LLQHEGGTGVVANLTQADTSAGTGVPS